ncbi:MAG: hypothetical protein Kow00120_26110 [Anaerolineae bacterium]
MSRALDRLTFGFLAIFAVIGLTLGYWTLVQGPAITARDDNPRLVDRERRLARGAIYDRRDRVLAESVANGDGTFTRVFPHPEAASAVGYYSLRYGADAVEAAFDATLRGASRYTAWDALLHRPEVGGDVRLTLDLDVQRPTAEALGDRAGGVIVIEADTGAVLALVSSPTFDPNTLDANWDALTSDPGAPLLDRVTEGQYQPGAALQTVALAAALAQDAASAQEVALSAEPYTLDLNGETITLACAHPPNGPLNDVFDAYARACPAPFAALGHALGAEALTRTFAAWGLTSRPALLPGALPASEAPADATADPGAMSLGQGGMTVNPAQMVRVVAAVANGGALPALHLVLETRPPGGGQWEPIAAPGNPAHVLPVAVAQQLQTALRAAAEIAGVGGVAGHAGLALSGPESRALAWFIGYAVGADGRPLAVAVVIEDAGDAAAAANVGAAALRAATAR